MSDTAYPLHGSSLVWCKWLRSWSVDVLFAIEVRRGKGREKWVASCPNRVFLQVLQPSHPPQRCRWWMTGSFVGFCAIGWMLAVEVALCFFSFSLGITWSYRILKSHDSCASHHCIYCGKNSNCRPSWRLLMSVLGSHSPAGSGWAVTRFQLQFPPQSIDKDYPCCILLAGSESIFYGIPPWIVRCCPMISLVQNITAYLDLSDVDVALILWWWWGGKHAICGLNSMSLCYWKSLLKKTLW